MPLFHGPSVWWQFRLDPKMSRGVSVVTVTSVCCLRDRGVHARARVNLYRGIRRESGEASSFNLDLVTSGEEVRLREVAFRGIRLMIASTAVLIGDRDVGVGNDGASSIDNCSIDGPGDCLCNSVRQ